MPHRLRVLSVGHACLDIINNMDHYPEEDSKSRAQSSAKFRGGNAANTIAVIAQLNDLDPDSLQIECELLSPFADDDAATFLRRDLESRGISVANCVTHAGGHTPTSYVIRNTTNGSRTIVHYRELPELSQDDFKKVDPLAYTWIHFEGRNIHTTVATLKALRETLAHVPRPPMISVELERQQDALVEMAAYGDLVFFSKEWAKSNGHSNAVSCLNAMKSRARPNAVLVCAWGTDGAFALDVATDAHSHAPAYPPYRVVDTLGAGDAFNAAMVVARGCGLDVPTCLNFACRVAGSKCGITGFDGIVEALKAARFDTTFLK